MPTVGDVFVPGGLPSITYNPRASLKLEERVRDYLDQRHKILSLSGPTKSGKTVLLKTVVPDAIWIPGGSISSVSDFWESLTDHLGGYTEIGEESASGESSSRSGTGGVSGGIPTILQGRGEVTRTKGTSEDQRESKSRSRPAHLVAGERLRASNIPVVIDDFHYLAAEVQVGIVRGLRELIFDGVPVILASVPHRAYDAVRVEKEMTGRVEQLQITFWSKEELEGIANKGFEALNVEAEQGIIDRLTQEAFSSPLLMQEFGLQLCLENEIHETAAERQEMDTPDWDQFFSERASGASKIAFDLLIQGPRQRTDRVQRILVNDTTVDIYGAVLAAIAATGPLTEIDYMTLRSSLREVMKSEAPGAQEVTRVLERMSDIAREKIEGEPVVDYDPERNTLFISDPFSPTTSGGGPIRPWPQCAMQSAATKQAAPLPQPSPSARVPIKPGGEAQPVVYCVRRAARFTAVWLSASPEGYLRLPYVVLGLFLACPLVTYRPLIADLYGPLVPEDRGPRRPFAISSHHLLSGAGYPRARSSPDYMDTR